MTLTWLAPTGTDPAASYVIEAGSAPGLANLANFSTGSTATTFSASGVGSGSYYVRVRAANSSGTSAASNEVLLVVGETACTAPSAPTNLTTVTNSGGTVVLSWTAGSGSPTTYIVEAGSAAGLSDLVNSDLGGPTPSLTATGVGNGTYYVRIRARNACGTSAASNEITLVVGTTTAAASVTGRWVGLIANGDGVVSTLDECGVEKFDWQLDLVQSGSSVTGTVTQRTVISGCEETGRLKTATINGTVSGNTFAFSLVAGTKAALPGTLTFTNTRMTGTMCNGPSCGGSNSIVLNKQ